MTLRHQAIHIVWIGINSDYEIFKRGIQGLRRFSGRRGGEVALKLVKKGIVKPIRCEKKFDNG